MNTHEPIIQSLLDIDFYKFTMGQLVFKYFRTVPVRYALKNRTKGVRLAAKISESDLRREFDHVRTLRFGKSELHYLRGTNEYSERMFGEAYLEFLSDLELPPYTLAKNGDEYELTFAGDWSTAIYWETIALSIVNELYYRNLMANMHWRFEREILEARAKLSLWNKLDLLRQYPWVRFSDFGTRRRFSREWQDYVVRVLKEVMPQQFLGTSNVYLASKYDLLPMGTSAHELFMVAAGIDYGSDDAVRASHNKMLECWWREYGYGLSIALSDTYGSEFFFRDMSAEQAKNWKGLRQDSGDPIAFGERAITFYKSHGLDPTQKLIVFSDGLGAAQIVRIAKHFKSRIKTTFGWGTNLTNDYGFPLLSLVVKVVEANGHGVVKLSDNIAKATGTLGDIERFKKIFGYTNIASAECRY